MTNLNDVIAMKNNMRKLGELQELINVLGKTDWWVIDKEMAYLACELTIMAAQKGLSLRRIIDIATEKTLKEKGEVS